MDERLFRLSRTVKIRSFFFTLGFGMFCMFGFLSVSRRSVADPEPVLTEILTSLIEVEALNGTSVQSKNRTKWKPESEVRHIAFLKVHKTGSSTVLNIMYRFATKRGLNLVLPKYGNYLELDTPNTVIPHPRNESYDILCNHVKAFNETLFAKYLPSDTFYIGIVREPLERLHSAFWYYTYVYPAFYLQRVSYTYRIHTFEKYIQNPYRFEPSHASESHTNNRMAIDFGYDENMLRNKSLFYSHIQHLDSVFDLVMVTEYFEESIVLLRRYLKWPLKDILHLNQNKQTKKQKLIKKPSLIRRAKEYLALDYILYEHYLQMFHERLKLEGEEFQVELKYFRKINKLCKEFCSMKTKAEVLYFPETSLSENFNVTFADCVLMQKEEFDFLKFIRDPDKNLNTWMYFAVHSEYSV